MEWQSCRHPSTAKLGLPQEKGGSICCGERGIIYHYVWSSVLNWSRYFAALHTVNSTCLFDLENAVACGLTDIMCTVTTNSPSLGGDDSFCLLGWIISISVSSIIMFWNDWNVIERCDHWCDMLHNVITCSFERGQYSINPTPQWKKRHLSAQYSTEGWRLKSLGFVFTQVDTDLYPPPLPEIEFLEKKGPFYSAVVIHYTHTNE
jgi:hypothetical protein